MAGAAPSFDTSGSPGRDCCGSDTDGAHIHAHAHAQPGLGPMIAAGAAAVAAEAAHWAGAPWLLAAGLAAAAIALCGLGTYREGWIAIRHGRLDINALMSIAVTGAFVLGQWPEAAMVMVLFALAEHIEARSLDRARHAVRDLLRLAPDQAWVRQAGRDWARVPVDAVRAGTHVRVLPGERIALDGEVLDGQSSVDQSAITGESLPLERAAGDPLYAGTVNLTGTLEYRTSSAAQDSTLARIIRSIEAAQAARAPTQRFTDRFARVYTPLVVLLALAIAAVPPLADAGGWYEWTYRALVLLVIACPCALVISTPIAIVSGLAVAARHGVLVKGGVYLEQARRLRRLALDKTGTLTQGRPALVGRETLDVLEAADCDRLAATLAAESNHPVSRAIAAGLALAPAGPPGQFQALAGRGIQGSIAGKTHLLGNHRLIHEHGLCSPALEARLGALEQDGHSAVLLADGHAVLALYAVADAVRPESAAAIRALQDLGIEITLLSGDNAHTVAAIADALGIRQAQGDLLPQDKLQALQRLAAAGETTGMVGDGVNDAPALARADIGFAMGAMGTDAAIETADVALMNDDLRKIPWLIGLSKATHRILVQNVAAALGIKALFLLLTVAGLGTMWMAVFADVGASLLVTGNSLRLLRHG